MSGAQASTFSSGSRTRPCKIGAGVVLYISTHGVFLFTRYKYMNRFINYLKDTRAELTHVSWPTRRQALIFTAVVIAISIAMAAFLGFFDYIFSLILQKFIL